MASDPLLFDPVDPAVAEEIDFLLDWIGHLIFALDNGG